MRERPPLPLLLLTNLNLSPREILGRWIRYRKYMGGYKRHLWPEESHTACDVDVRSTSGTMCYSSMC